MGAVTKRARPEPPAAAFRKAFRIFENGGHHVWRVFADFIEMAAMSLANSTRPDPVREARYMEIVGRYTREEVDTLCRMLALVVDGVSMDRDFLGEVFMEMEMANHWRGQFFTPFTVAEGMARLVYGMQDAAAIIGDKGFITLLEPASGAGAMVIAFAKVMREQGLEPQRHLHVTAVDVDPTAAFMCYVQLTLLGIPGVVYVGDTLRMEMRQELHTFMHDLGLWDHRLRAARRVEVAPSTPPPAAIFAQPNPQHAGACESGGCGNPQHPASVPPGAPQLDFFR